MRIGHDMEFLIKDIPTFKQQALAWANQESSTVCYLDSNAYQEDKYSSFDCVIGIAVADSITLDIDAIAGLRAFDQKHRGEWMMGYWSYDLKNELEDLTSNNLNSLNWAKLHFFVPLHVVLIDKKGSLKILSKTTSPETIYKAIQETSLSLSVDQPIDIEIETRISKSDYLATLQKIRQHIIDGDLYEMNFCQEFHAKKVNVNALNLFNKLNKLSKAPFAAYYKNKDQYLLCASPERFIKKEGKKIISQPIKGTMPRGKNLEEDEYWKNELKNSEKDQAENVMIVDLVRNDLSKSCEVGSIKVEELFGIYSFEQVFQMISTIRGELREEKNWIDVIEQAFPMGSMTGAPKVMSMQLIEEYESVQRGVYSGAVGYVSPERNFDFNVVIRSLFYNQEQQYLSFQVGGAIVYDSVPENEYEECLLKAKGMLAALGATIKAD